ncbi:MAG: hypothetical protein ACFFDF_01345 [Candidatus Odinarchaeota archaeon]
MSEHIDLKSLEKKAYRSTFDDGLWDLFTGLIILSLGIASSVGSLFNLSEIWITIIPALVLNIIAFLIFYLGKKFVTVPRIGFVKFGQKRKSKQLKLKIFLIIFAVVNLILAILPFTGLLRTIPVEPLLITLILGIGFFTFPLCITAYFLDFTRLYYYALLAGMGLFLTNLIHPMVGAPFDTLLTFGIIGVGITVIGLYYFIQFLKKYPLSK